MNSIIFVASAIGATAGIFMFCFLIHIVRRWMDTRWLKQNGKEAMARIVDIEVVNETGRYLPFVPLKMEVSPNQGKAFTTEADAFFSVPELSLLTTGSFLKIRYNPFDPGKAQLIKPAQQKTLTDSMAWPQIATAPSMALAR